MSMDIRHIVAVTGIVLSVAAAISLRGTDSGAFVSITAIFLTLLIVAYLTEPPESAERFRAWSEQGHEGRLPGIKRCSHKGCDHKFPSSLSCCPYCCKHQ